jgi:RecJ-like exonuclease
MNTESNSKSNPGSTGSDTRLNPGDDAAAGTVGTGEDVCPVCKGSGKSEQGKECQNCGGTGKIIEGIGGG